jgi:hypothetical protein
MNLEHELSALADEIAWPPTPSLRPALAPRRRDLRRPALAAAVAVVALTAAFAAPHSRGAILRFLHLGAASIHFVDTLPAAQEMTLASTLGPAVAEPDARRTLGGTLLLPPTSTTPPLHANRQVVSLFFLYRGRPVVLSEAYTGSAVFIKKLATSSTSADFVQVGANPGVWLSGAPHVVLFPGAPARLAGDVLVWRHGRLTLRLEGHDLTEADAIELARSLR